MGPVASIRSRDVVRVAGPDAVSFLQGQLSQDVAGLAVGTSAWSLLLQPQGKVEAWVRVHRTADDTVLVEVDAGWGDAVLSRLRRFHLRVDCTLTLEDRWTCVEVRGDGAEEVGEAVGATGDELVAPSIWPGAPGVDLVGRPAAVPDGVVVDDAAVEALRICAGVPRMGAELDDSVIPAEAGPWLVDRSASFTKGCYVGQELVARVESRGSNTPRHLRGLRLHGPAEVGEELVDEAGRAVGRITSVAGDLALGYVARSVEVPVVLRTEDGTDLTAAALPLSDPEAAPPGTAG